MNIFTEDIDFSKDFYSYLEKSYDKNIQEKEIEKKNNIIIKNNINKLENCIRNNLSSDNTIPFDKTFICSNFKYLLKNNKGETERDRTINLDQYTKPFSNINLIKSNNNITDDKFKFYSGFPIRNLRGTYEIKSNIIEKNRYSFIDDTNVLILRISNTTSEFQPYEIIHSIWYK